MSASCKVETRGFAADLIELDDLVGVALEQLKESCLRARGALGASELEPLADGLNVLEVHHQLLDPLRSALAYAPLVPRARGN
jgi:hypothetical protein